MIQGFCKLVKLVVAGRSEFDFSALAEKRGGGGEFGNGLSDVFGKRIGKHNGYDNANTRNKHQLIGKQRNGYIHGHHKIGRIEIHHARRCHFFCAHHEIIRIVLILAHPVSKGLVSAFARKHEIVFFRTEIRARFIWPAE